MGEHFPRDLKEKVESAKALLESAHAQAQTEGNGRVAAFLHVSLSYIRAGLEGLSKK